MKEQKEQIRVCLVCGKPGKAYRFGSEADSVICLCSEHYEAVKGRLLLTPVDLEKQSTCDSITD